MAVRRRRSAEALSSVLEKDVKNSDDTGDLPSFSLSRFPRSRATSPLSAKDQIHDVGIFVSPKSLLRVVARGECRECHDLMVPAAFLRSTFEY